MIIKEINRAACKVIRDKLQVELETTGKKLGLTIHVGRATYSDTDVTFKVECILENVDKGKENFERDCYMFNLAEDTYQSEFTYAKQDWILQGVKPRSPKYPILASKAGEPGNYKLPERAVASLTSE